VYYVKLNENSYLDWKKWESTENIDEAYSECLYPLLKRLEQHYFTSSILKNNKCFLKTRVEFHDQPKFYVEKVK